MGASDLTLNWENSPAGLPLFKRIAESLVREVRRGRLRAGDKLPSSRGLAASLGVHRNTVLAAFDELETQGYIETVPARGTFVAADLPRVSAAQARRYERSKQAKLRLAKAPLAPSIKPIESDTLALLGGMPDLREVPTAALARGYRSALRQAPSTLDYQSVYGQPRFLSVFARFLAESRGVVAEEGEMLVTRGSQQALHLAARALSRPGSVIAVERAGYPPAWEGFRQAGATLRPVRTDAHGLVVSDLKKLCAEEDVCAVYVTPHHQYPTTVTMSGPRRLELLKLAEHKRFVIIEDDYDHEFHFESEPVLPLASQDSAGVVLHIGTLSKVFAPGLRLGYAVGQQALIESMAHSRAYQDRQGDHVTELALAYLIEDGELGAHIRRMHRVYEARREVLFEALEKHIPDLVFDRPSGGLAVWAKHGRKISATDWADRAAKKKVLVQPARGFFMDGKNRPYLRLGYARLDEGELKEAVRRLSLARPRA
jgi:GntR family transcriptional regulator/MocR family aminotransferase